MSSLSPDRQDERDNFENVFADVVGGSKAPKNSPKSTPWISLEISLCWSTISNIFFDQWAVFTGIHWHGEHTLGPQAKHPMDPVDSQNDDPILVIQLWAQSFCIDRRQIVKLWQATETFLSFLLLSPAFLTHLLDLFLCVCVSAQAVMVGRWRGRRGRRGL